MPKFSVSTLLPIVVVLPFAHLACESAAPVEAETPTEEEQGLGHCVYTNKFSKAEECRQYVGTEWTSALVEEDCASQAGTVNKGDCSYEATLGTCVLGEGEKQTWVVAPGADAAACSGQKLGCETFAGGAWQPEEICKDDDYQPPTTTVFQPPELICKDPVNGEAAGQGEDGKVCTWGMISGCTEPGRKFTEYASCEDVYTQRPYYPVPPPPNAAEPDPRMEDPNYVSELNWVKEQVEACACVCCHQDSVTPQGAGMWDIEGKGNWINTFTPYGLAFAGGFVPSWPLGAYPKEENNGFDRSVTGLPTTDVARMQAFFEAELKHRGTSGTDFADYDPTPSFFYDQHTFNPGSCNDGEGVGADGKMTWKGGWARYVFVLEDGSDNPGVPPNLDLPEGTVWKLDARPESNPLKSGDLTFGKVPTGTFQAFPAEGSPELTKGKTYYLYVLADVGIPITRCTFEAK
ncbi:MAG: proteinase inhibitor [Polyangiaceae bacterium]|nr:proteinase inhibitor [Polyangiaceae bacterium]